MKLTALILILLFLFPGVAFCQKEKPVEALLFTSASCKPCQEIKRGFLHGIKEKYRAKIDIEEFDIGEAKNYLKLLELQEAYGLKVDKILTPTIFIEGKFLAGSKEIKRYFEIYINLALSRTDYAVGQPVSKPQTPPEIIKAKSLTGRVSKDKSSPDLISRFKLINSLTVITAGLVDGVNPCAFTAIIFFISFLALQGYGKRQVLAIGLSFILAVYLIYVLIGLGLFSFLFKLKPYWSVVRVVYIAGAMLCFVLAGLAFYDFKQFRRNRQEQDLILQLPAGLKQRIRRVIGSFYRRDKTNGQERQGILKLICFAFVVGGFISIFEAICTGQVYLPTIVFVFKTAPFKLRAFSYLLIYNLMFILPLCLILLLALWGVTSAQFGNFVKRHMGAIKILMAVLFLVLGVFLIWQ